MFLIILPLMRILQRNLKRTTDTFLFISHTTNVLLFEFRCNISIGVRIIKEMPGSVASGTPCIIYTAYTLDKAATAMKKLPWTCKSIGQSERCLKLYQTHLLLHGRFGVGCRVLESRSRRVLSGMFFQQSESARWEWSLRRMGNWLSHF